VASTGAYFINGFLRKTIFFVFPKKKHYLCALVMERKEQSLKSLTATRSFGEIWTPRTTIFEWHQFIGAIAFLSRPFFCKKNVFSFHAFGISEFFM
jgi:hypothetical protein